MLSYGIVHLSINQKEAYNLFCSLILFVKDLPSQFWHSFKMDGVLQTFRSTKQQIKMKVKPKVTEPS